MGHSLQLWNKFHELPIGKVMGRQTVWALLAQLGYQLKTISFLLCNNDAHTQQSMCSTQINQ